MRVTTACPICGGTQFTTAIQATDHTATKEIFTIQKCAECNLQLTNPRPVDLAPYYKSPDYISHSNKAKSLFDRLYVLARNRTMHWKHNLVSKYTNKTKILDYGCGTGAFLGYLKSKGWLVHGVEPSIEAQANLSPQLHQNEVLDSIEKIQEFYPMITLWHVLEHVADLNTTIAQLSAHLDSNGTMLIAVPNVDSWESTIYKQNWAAYDVPRHLWHFNRQSFRTLIDKHHLSVKEIIPMKLDAIYISMLSEKYNNHGSLGIWQIIRGLYNGLLSNYHAKESGNYSSLIYVIKKRT